MASASTLGREYVAAARKAAREVGVADEALASALLCAVIELMRELRAGADVAAQLRFEADNAEEAEDFPFMRP